jgi:RNA polymerase sigma factor (TIGR02999 family)
VDTSEPITQLIRGARDGNDAAADALFAAAYDDLRRLARARLRRCGRHTLLDTGSLVHESYLRFASSGRLQVEDRTHFMRWAATVMRSVVIDLARRRLASRRGSGAARVPFAEDIAEPRTAEDEIIAVHEAVRQIAAFDARLAQVVEMRYFAGMVETEIAQALNITERTVRRDWEKARLLLREALQPLPA